MIRLFSWGDRKSREVFCRIGDCRTNIGHISRTKTQIKHFARISRLQKFVISKSQNPEIASSLTLKRCDFWRIFSIWNQENFLRMIFLAKWLDCLHNFTIYSSIVCLKVSQNLQLQDKRRSNILQTSRTNIYKIEILIILNESVNIKKVSFKNKENIIIG